MAAEGSEGYGGVSIMKVLSRQEPAAATRPFYSCQHCGRTFKRKSNLACHLRLHSGERPFACTHCHLAFTHKSSLLHHTRLHTGEKPYECRVCRKTFRQRPNYSLHMKTHTGEKLFRCGTCGKEFAQRVHLTTHARLHTGEKPFACQHCDKRFFQRCHLTRHQGTHSPVKPHECNVCGKRFSCQSYLATHLKKTHGNLTRREKPKSTGDGGKVTADAGPGKQQECEVCHKTFLKKCHLRHHMFTHTGERPYHCPRCGRRFSEAGSLRRHMYTHDRAPLTPGPAREEPPTILNSSKRKWEGKGTGDTSGSEDITAASERSHGGGSRLIYVSNSGETASTPSKLSSVPTAVEGSNVLSNVLFEDEQHLVANYDCRKLFVECGGEIGQENSRENVSTRVHLARDSNITEMEASSEASQRGPVPGIVINAVTTAPHSGVNNGESLYSESLPNVTIPGQLQYDGDAIVNSNKVSCLPKISPNPSSSSSSTALTVKPSLIAVSLFLFGEKVKEEEEEEEEEDNIKEEVEVMEEAM